jgi:hypothetical protein
MRFSQAQGHPGSDGLVDVVGQRLAGDHLGEDRPGVPAGLEQAGDDGVM